MSESDPKKSEQQPETATWQASADEQPTLKPGEIFETGAGEVSGRVIGQVNLKQLSFPDNPTLHPDANHLTGQTADRNFAYETVVEQGQKPTGEGPHGKLVKYFGDYELLDEIARGGMGVVYRARQINLNRIVALKMILTGQLASEDDVLRFQTEAEAAAQLDHAGIVPIFEIGQHEGQHYFSMGFIEGESLADRISGTPLPAMEAASIVASVCSAITYAHQRGVIHRDLKPANVLIDLNGQPKVTDFGLAKRSDNDSGLTGTGQILGTPSYMPPEQASGKIDQIGPLADVYSIGAILYCAITGRPPFQAASPMDTLLQVLEKDPVAPRQLNPAIDQDLQTICLKSLEKQPQRRYGSAQELLDELQRYLNGDPIHARPISQIERARRWCRRKPALAGALALAGLLIMVLSIGGPAIALRQSKLKEAAQEAGERATNSLELAEQQKEQAEQSRLAAEQASERAIKAKASTELALREVEETQERAEGLLYAARISLAYREWLDCNPTRVQQLLNECPESMRLWEWHYLDSLLRAEQMAIFAHDFPRSAQFLPSGKKLLTRGNQDFQIKVWDVATGLEEHASQIPGIRDVTNELDDEHLLVTHGNTLTLIQPPAMEKYGEFGVPATGGRLLAGGKGLVGAFVDGTIVIYKRPGGEEVFRTPSKLVSDRAHLFAPDGRLVVSTKGLNVIVWDVRSGEVKHEISGHGWAISDICFSRDGQLLASADQAGNLIVTNVASGQRIHRIPAHNAAITAVAFSHDHQQIVTGSIDRTCRVFDVTTGAQLLTIRGHTGAITDVDFDLPGELLLTASADGTARLWKFRQRLNIAPDVKEKLNEQQVAILGHAPGLESQIYYGSRGPLYDVKFSPDSRFAATSGFTSDETQKQDLIKVWSLEDATLSTSFSVPGGVTHTMQYSADNRYLIVASAGAGDAFSPSTITIWDLASKSVLRRLEGESCMFARAQLNQQQDVLVVMYGSLSHSKLQAFTFPECEPTHGIEVEGERMCNTAFSASGSEVLSATAPGGKIRAWNPRSGESLVEFAAHGTGVFAIDVDSRDRLASASIDGDIAIWDWRNQNRLGELKGHNKYAVDIAFSPDGRRLASSSEDQTVKVWDVDHFTELLSFRDHTDAALCVDWSSDGRQIASTSRDGAMIVRKVGNDRNLEPDESWTTIFADDFEREELGDNWSGEGWRIESGKAIGTLQPMTAGGTSFPGCLLALPGVNLPRTLDVSVDVTLRVPMLAQVVLVNSRTSQYIAPFIASTTKPYGFIGSMVQVARGAGQENKTLGGRTKVSLVPGQTYRLRVVRHIDQLRFYLDDHLLEHVRVPTLEANLVMLGGAYSKLGDAIEFDNIVVRVPAELIRQQEISADVSKALARMLIPDLVSEDIGQMFPAEAERKLAESFLKRLAAGKDLSLDAIIQAFDEISRRSDASPEEYELARRQAEYYYAREPSRWHLGKIAMAILRSGNPDRALLIFDQAIAENLAGSGHGLGLLHAGRALALQALSRQADAEVAHLRFRDSNWTNLGNQNPMPRLAAELMTKVPIADEPIRKSVLDVLLRYHQRYWYSRNVNEVYQDILPDFVRTQGRSQTPDRFDVTYAQAGAMRLDAIETISNPPPQLQLLWEDIEVSYPTSDTAVVRWIVVNKFDNYIFRFGQAYELRLVEDVWKIARERTWQVDRRIEGQWQRHDQSHWKQLDARIEKLRETQDPKMGATLIEALRFSDAYQWAVKTLAQKPDDAAALVVLGESAIKLGKFEDGCATLEHARKIQPDVHQPWFYSRIRYEFADHNAISFDLDQHPTEPLMVTAHEDRALVIWDIHQRKVVRKIDGAHARSATGVKFSVDGSEIYSIGFDGILNIFDTASGSLKDQLAGHLAIIYRIERHPQKNIVVTSSADRTAKLWDLDARKELRTLSGHGGQVMGASFNPDGSRIATASVDGTVRIWDTETGRELSSVDAHKEGAWRVDWTPDGQRLLSCGRDGQVCVWNAKNLIPLAKLSGHTAHVEVVRVSPDGRLAASGDVAGQIWVWDLEKLVPLVVLRDGNDIYDLQFRAETLLSVGDTVTEWDIDFSSSPLQRSLHSLAK